MGNMVLDTSKMCAFCNCKTPPSERRARYTVNIGDFPTPLCSKHYKEYEEGELLVKLQFDIYGDISRDYTEE